jgi:hypothetical protein
MIEPAENEMPEGGESEAAETTELPMSIAGGQPVGVGDVIRLRVVSVNDDNGTFAVEYDQPKTKREPSNSEEMASDLAAESQYNLDA